MEVEVEDEDSVVHEKKTADKKSTDGKKNEVRGESNQEKEIENEKNEKEEKEEKNHKNAKKSRSEKVVDEGVEVPYPVVPSKKEKDRHLERFSDIFRKLEITIPSEKLCSRCQSTLNS